MNQHALLQSILRRKANLARRMSIDERLTAGARLYAEQLELTRDFIAGLNPDWTTVQVEAEIRRRLQVIRERDTAKFYRPVANERDVSVDERP